MKSGTKRQYKDLKVKPGQILFVPCDNRLLEMQPHVNSSSNPPGWFRKIGKFPGSLRRCAGISDYLSIGVTFPAWSNFRFKNAGHDSIWEVATDQFELPKDKYPLSDNFVRDLIKMRSYNLLLPPAPLVVLSS